MTYEHCSEGRSSRHPSASFAADAYAERGCVPIRVAVCAGRVDAAANGQSYAAGVNAAKRAAGANAAKRAAGAASCPLRCVARADTGDTRYAYL